MTEEHKDEEPRRIVIPDEITEEMMKFARPSPDDLWHWARNLNAMMRSGYCSKCGLVPQGCRSEGCLAHVKMGSVAELD